MSDATGELLPMKLEVVVIPVSDVDRSLRFYQGLGWRLDADFEAGPEFRIVQLTPPGSPCSIHIGRGLTPSAPGSALGNYLVVSDIDRTRADLASKGVDLSPVYHNVYDTGTPVQVDGYADNRPQLRVVLFIQRPGRQQVGSARGLGATTRTVRSRGGNRHQPEQQVRKGTLLMAMSFEVRAASKGPER
jgi:catechol 2,3-dioxygenase-like lactoylglutathione lyase family enzyme